MARLLRVLKAGFIASFIFGQLFVNSPKLFAVAYGRGVYNGEVFYGGNCAKQDCAGADSSSPNNIESKDVDSPGSPESGYKRARVAGKSLTEKRSAYDWLAYLCFVLGATIFIWFIVGLYRRHKEDDSSSSF